MRAPLSIISILTLTFFCSYGLLASSNRPIAESESFPSRPETLHDKGKFSEENPADRPYGVSAEEFAEPVKGLSKKAIFEQLNPNKTKSPIWASDPIKVTMSGFIMNNIFWDTRQNITFQLGDSLLVPQELKQDPQGNDINAHGDFGIVPIETNLRFDFDGPYIGCAKTSGVIETNFFGLNDFTLNVNELTMLKAFMQFSWDNLDIVVGQTYHPLLYPANLPNTVGYSIGNPFNPFAYAPQFQFLYRFPHAEVIFAALSEINNPNLGPIAPSADSFVINENIGFSHTFFKNSMMPKLHLQFRVPLQDYVFGIAYDAKRLVPRLETNTGYKSFESLFSSTGIAYIEMHKEPWVGLLKATVAQNGIDYGIIGGYAVHSIEPITDRRTYTNFTVGALLADFEYHAEIFQPGIFMGVLKGLGAGKSIIQSIETPRGTEQTVYGLGENVDVAFRISPRLRYNIPPVVVATEFEYTQSRAGTLLDSGKISGNGRSVGNWRFLLAMFYFF